MNFATLSNQIPIAFQQLQLAPTFILKHKLWQGFLNQNWIYKILVAAAVIFSLFFFLEILEIISGEKKADNYIGILGGVSINILFSGGMKYVILILLETLIFHFSSKTLEILTGVKKDYQFKDFMQAQIRMIKVSLRCWIFEIIILFLLMVVLSIFGINFLETFCKTVVQFYFLGFAFLDNYSEQFGLTIKESGLVIYQHMGAALIIGFVAYFILFIPLIGSIIASFICAVAATTYMHTNVKDLNMELARVSKKSK